MFDAAATLEVLRRDGWCQDEYHNSEGSHCILGAANAEVQTHRYDQARATLEPIILAQFPEMAEHENSMRLIPIFNDHPDTTFADVEMVLEKAAVNQMEWSD